MRELSDETRKKAQSLVYHHANRLMSHKQEEALKYFSLLSKFAAAEDVVRGFEWLIVKKKLLCLVDLNRVDDALRMVADVHLNDPMAISERIFLQSVCALLNGKSVLCK
jgi:hypothetical protein